MQEDEVKALTGAWIQATGTVICAVGSTPTHFFTKEQSEGLIIIGNVMQAVGNSLIADSIPAFSLDKIGFEIQAIGNLFIVTGFTLPFDEITEVKLDIKGNLLQVLGENAELSATLAEEPSRLRQLNITGNVLQQIGNSTQAIAGGRELRGMDGEALNAIGSWVQATGSLLQAIVFTKEKLDDSGEGS